MTPRERANDCLLEALKERDRGWLFIPKWVLLPYLRALDRSINVNANTDGLARYHKDSLKACTIRFIIIRLHTIYSFSNFKSFRLYELIQVNASLQNFIAYYNL